MSVTYVTERLLLKTLNKDAAPMVLDFYEDNRSLFEPWEPKRGTNFYTQAYQKASLTAEHNQMAEGKLLRLWVFLKDNPDEIIGSVCYQNFLKEPYLSCTMGYKFSHRYLHQGYATESLLSSMEVIFNEYHIHRIEAFIMPANEPSLRLIERLSFTYEGISASFARIGGGWADHRRYSYINPKDMTELKSSPEGTSIQNHLA